MQTDPINSPDEIRWTGERFMPDVGPEIAMEHYSRYHLAQEFARGKDILDCPSGEGFGSDILARVAKNVLGVDISSSAVAHASRKYRRANLAFEQSSMDDLKKLNDESVDVVVCLEGIEHVSPDVQERAITEFSRILRPNGHLIISTPNKRVYSDLRNYQNEYHLREFYRDEFYNFLKKSFLSVQLYGQAVVDSCLIYNLKNPDISHIKYRVFKSETESDLEMHSASDLWRYFIAICSKTELNAPLDGLSLIDPQGLLQSEKLSWLQEQNINQINYLNQQLDYFKNRTAKFENQPLIKMALKLRRYLMRG